MNSILIIHQYGSTPSSGYGGRSFFLASEFAKKNNTCLVLANHSHLRRNMTEQRSCIELNSGCPFRIIAVKVLRARSSRSLLRVINWMVFMVKLCLLTESSIGFRPSKIIYTSPSLLGYLGAYFLSLRFKSKLYFEVRDIWPLTIVSLSAKYKKNILVKLMEKVEKFAYKTCDGLISNLSALPEHIAQVSSVMPPFLFLPNGIKLLDNATSTNTMLIRSEELTNILLRVRQLKNNERQVVCYCGGLGPLNAMELFIEAAAEAKNDDNIFWLIVGDGPEKDKLQSLSKMLLLKNIEFFPSVQKEDVPHVLEAVDILFLAHHFIDLYRYGVSPKKLPEYLLSGTPVIHVTNSLSLIKVFKCGFIVSDFEPKAVVSCVYQISRMCKKDLKRKTDNAIQSVKQSLLYENLANELQEFLELH